VAAAAAAGGTQHGDGQLLGAGRFTAVVISTALILFLLAVLIVVLLTLKRARRRWQLEKPSGGGVAGGVVMERRWTEADGAEEMTAKQRLNSCVGAEKTSTLCFRRPVDDAGGVYHSSDGHERSCFNVQHQFEVVWQASSPCCLRQVYMPLFSCNPCDSRISFQVACFVIIYTNGNVSLYGHCTVMPLSTYGSLHQSPTSRPDKDFGLPLRTICVFPL